MIYSILFQALTTAGDQVGIRGFTIKTNCPLDETKKLCLERMCVEYARLTGLKCSHAHIVWNIEKRGSKLEDVD